MNTRIYINILSIDGGRLNGIAFQMPNDILMFIIFFVCVWQLSISSRSSFGLDLNGGLTGFTSFRLTT